ncbi:MAG: CvpA family protein [Gammaproteobacteria bacterium]|nr:MAG: CvpA family protein [Gammaproteobacteria bacterium]
MIWIDFAILGLIAISAIIGLFRGFVREAFSLLTWIVAVGVALHFSRDFTVYFDSFISLPSARVAASFVVLFLVTLILGGFISYLIAELVDKTGLTGTDRLLGLLFGIARGMVVIAVLVVLAGLTPLPEDPWWKESSLIQPFESLAVWLRSHIPDSMAGYLTY